MSLTAQFVDSISDTAAVRLDLNDHATWEVKREGTSTPPPPLRRVMAGTPLVDGEVVPAAAYGNRSVVIALRCKAVTADAAAAAVQALTRELHRPVNFLRWRPDTTEAVYFRTVRSEYAEFRWDPVLRKARLEIMAEPYAYGPEENPLSTGLVVSDTFTRTVANGWGAADSGQAWTTSGGAASDYSTTGTVGRHTHTATGVLHHSLADAGATDVEVLADVTIAIGVAGSAAISTWVAGRAADNNNYYVAALALGVPSGGSNMTLTLGKRVVGALTNFTSVGVGSHTSGATWRIRFRCIGSLLQAKAWLATTAEPASWQLQFIDASPLTAGTLAGPLSRFEVGNTNTLPQNIDFDNFSATEIVGVINDPAVPGPILNANPFFETDASNWTAIGGTVARSTAQAHQGSASLLLTPDGVSTDPHARAESVPAVAGRRYRATMWVRLPVSRTVTCGINWRDAAGALMGTSLLPSVTVSANTWTLLDFSATAPANTALAQLAGGVLPGAALVSDTVHIDEAMLREEGAPGSMYVDITGVKGDVETPMVLRADQADVNAVSGTAIGIRRRGVVADVPFVSQAEAWTLLTDTTLQANDPTASGAGSNFVRCSFGTNAAMVDRMTVTHPTVPTDATRGLYRVFARVRRSSAASDTTVRVQLRRATITNPAATLALSTAWQWVDLGYLPIPGGADQAANFAGLALDSGSVALWLQAERVGPTAVTLDVDVDVFVPADDGFALVTWSSHGATGWTVLDGPLDAAYALDSAGRVAAVNPAPVAVPAVPMLAPGVTNRLYLVKRALGGADTLAEAVRLDVSYYPRYLFVRPLAG